MKPPLTVGSLFSGIGGIDLGLERAGMQVVFQVEVDPYARSVLNKHWPSVPRFRDVRSVSAWNLPPCDVLAGGFPCQDLSYAGKGAGITGARSGLWREFARLIRELRPRYVLVENVPALLGRGIDVVLGDLAACGYDAEWQCISAASVGAPHIRDRVWIVADANGQRCEQQYAPAVTSPASQSDWLADAFDVADADSTAAGVAFHRGSGQGRAPSLDI